MLSLIYLDNAATTPLHPEILASYQELLSNSFANSESIYDLGFNVKKQLEKSRKIIAKLFAVRSNDLIFTSGASEANAMAIKGYALAQQVRGKHLITTNVEHSSVLNAFEQLETTFGFEVTYLEVNKEGFINLDELKTSLRNDTTLVSIMAINNEIGTIQPLSEISAIIKENSKAIFHVDAVQALGKIDLDFSLFDMASFSAHKINGLKGSGLLYKRAHLEIEPLIHGGSQEFGLRGGTSNAAVHILLAKTIRLALESQKENEENIKEIKQFCIEKLRDMKNFTIHTPVISSDYIVSFSSNSVPSEIMLNGLVANNIYVSARSTCHSRDDSYSYVLEAIGADEQEKKSVIRISMGYKSTKEDLIKTFEIIRELVNYVKS